MNAGNGSAARRRFWSPRPKASPRFPPASSASVSPPAPPAVYSFGRNSPWGLLGSRLARLSGSVRSRRGGTQRSHSLVLPFAAGDRRPRAGRRRGCRRTAQHCRPAVRRRAAAAHERQPRSPRDQGAVAISWRGIQAALEAVATKRWGKAVKFTSLSCSAESPCSYVISDTTMPLEFELNSLSGANKIEKQRQIVGAPLPEPGAPVAVAPPTISGIGHVGQTLSDVSASWSNEPDELHLPVVAMHGSDEEACAPIAGATSRSYVPVTADLNHSLRVAESWQPTGPAPRRPSRGRSKSSRKRRRKKSRKLKKAKAKPEGPPTAGRRPRLKRARQGGRARRPPDHMGPAALAPSSAPRMKSDLASV